KYPERPAVAEIDQRHKPHPADHLFPRYSSRPLGRPRRIESELEELLPGHPPMIGGRVAEEQQPLDRPGETRHSKHDERPTPPAGDNDPNDERRRSGAPNAAPARCVALA